MDNVRLNLSHGSLGVDPLCGMPGYVRAAIDYSEKIAKIGIPNFIEACNDGEKCVAVHDDMHLFSSARYTHLAATGDHDTLIGSEIDAHIASSGSFTNVLYSGGYSHIASSGHASTIFALGGLDSIAASGDQSCVETQGVGICMASSGRNSQMHSNGHYSTMVSAGVNSQLVAESSLSRLASAGNSSIVRANGDSSIAVSMGAFSQVSAPAADPKLLPPRPSLPAALRIDEDQSPKGHGSIVVALGRCNKAAAAKGSWITLAEWGCENDEWMPVCVKTEYVDGARIKENTFYMLVNGEFTPVQDDDRFNP